MPTTARSLAPLAAAAIVALAGCSSSSSPTATGPVGTAGSAGSAATTPGTEAETYEIVPDATVTAGLAEVRSLAAKARDQLAADPAAAKATAQTLKDRWFTFEGTVRQKDKARYLSLEDAMADITRGIDQGKADRVAKGVADLDRLAAEYLQAHP